MVLFKETSTVTFNLEVIQKGDLVRAQYYLWPEPRNGVIIRATEREITILFSLNGSNISNYFSIPAQEAANGKWAIKWSPDFDTIYTFDEEDSGP